MTNHIHNFLNRPFPLFLVSHKGRVYFIWLTIILLLLANIVHPFGFVNSLDELHKPLVVTGYIVLFFGLYVLCHWGFSSFHHDHYTPDTWTVKKELNVLLFYIPTTACSTYFLTDIAIPGFELTVLSFLELQFYNILLSIVSIPTFGYFIDSKLNPIKILHRHQRLKIEARLNLTAERASDILQKLNKVMEIQQLYLTNKCSLKLIASYSDISVQHIFCAIYGYSDYNFTDFVNKYRVEHVCKILQEGKNQEFEPKSIVKEYGFGSKTNLYTSFLKFTGKTPTEYLANLSINSD